MKKINCYIGTKNYTLYPLVSKNQKRIGLRAFPDIGPNEGVIFIYKKASSSGFDFSKIPYSCKIFFMSRNFKVLHKEKTKPFQRKIVYCPKKFSYVIEIPD